MGVGMRDQARGVLGVPGDDGVPPWLCGGDVRDDDDDDLTGIESGFALRGERAGVRGERVGVRTSMSS